MGTFVNPYNQTASGGNPLSGGKLLFTDSGTNTPKDTFVDLDHTIPNANPVILDNDGGNGVIELAEDAPYRMTIFRADGSLFKQFDNVTGLGGGSGSPDHTWIPSAIYNIPDDVVGSDFKWYQSIDNGNMGNDPTSSPNDWTEYTKFKIWNLNETYIQDFIVQRSGIMYASRIPNNIGNTPESSPDEWSNQSGIGKQIFEYPAAGLTKRLTNGATFNEVVTGASSDMVISSYDFDPDAAQFVQFVVKMPSNWDVGTVDVIFTWSAATADTDDVVWVAQGIAFASSADRSAAAYGAVSTVTQSNVVEGAANFTAAISVTITDAVANGLVMFQVFRDATNVADTLASDARLENVVVLYTTNSSVVS